MHMNDYQCRGNDRMSLLKEEDHRTARISLKA